MPSTHAYAVEPMVGIVEGARVVGVSPGTLRRWADDGRVQTFRTPGNQRRFRLSDLQALLRPETAPDVADAPDERAS